jgi:hypothetical protein
VQRADDAARASEFTDGQQIGGIQISAPSDTVSQLLVSTAHSGITTSTSATRSTIVERILEICKELGVSREKPAR